MFACNEGGHFSQMMALNDLFGKYNAVLVTDNIRANKDMPSLKEIGAIEYALAMANERKKKKATTSKRINHITAHLQSFYDCSKIWKKYRPKVIVSTGSNLAVPLFWIGKLYGSKIIFVETRAKVYSRSLTGILVRIIADQIFVQWPEMIDQYPEAKYCGILV